LIGIYIVKESDLDKWSKLFDHY